MFIYFLQEGSDGPIKVGKTDQPWRRFNALQTGNPREVHFLKLAHVGDGASTLERQIHAFLRRHRIRGEWFHPHEDVYRSAGVFDDVTCSKCRRTELLTVRYDWNKGTQEATVLCVLCGGRP